jgi:hypothetical protein
MKTLFKIPRAWLRLLDVPIIIVTVGVAGVLVSIKLLAWGGLIGGGLSIAPRSETSASWISDRESAWACTQSMADEDVNGCVDRATPVAGVGSPGSMQTPQP